MMRTLLIALSAAALVQVAPSIAAEVTRDAGLTEIAEALDGVSSAEAAFIRRTKLRKKRTSGERHVLLVGLSANDTDPPDSVIVTFPEDPNQPEALPKTVTLSLVSADTDSGDLTFAADMDFSDDAVGFTYDVAVDVRAGDVSLSTTTESITVEAPGFPTVDLEVLNIANEAGDVVVLARDAVQVRFDISCAEPWDKAECAAELAQSQKADRIQLVGEDGEVLAAKKRGRALSGTVNLPTRRDHIGQRPSVVFVASDDGGVHAQSDAPIVIVDNPATAELMERIALTETAIAALDARVTANEDAIGANAETVASHGVILIQHLMLISDEKIKVELNAENIANNTGAVAALGERVAANEEGIAANQAGIGGNITSLIELEQLVGLTVLEVNDNAESIELNTSGVATNAAAIDNNREDIDANTDTIGDFVTDAFTYESSIEDLVEYTGSRRLGNGTLFDADGHAVNELGTVSYKGGGFTSTNVDDQLVVDVFIGVGQDGWLVVRPEDGGAAVAVPPLEPVGDGTFFAPVESDTPELVSGVYRTELLAVMMDGSIVGPLTTFVHIEFDPDFVRTISVDIRQRDATNFDVSVGVVGSAVGEVASVSVTVESFGGPPALPEAFEMNESTGNALVTHFTDGTLTFEEPDAVAGQVYGVLIELKNADGEVLDASFHEVVVGGL